MFATTQDLIISTPQLKCSPCQKKRKEKHKKTDVFSALVKLTVSEKMQAITYEHYQQKLIYPAINSEMSSFLLEYMFSFLI